MSTCQLKEFQCKQTLLPSLPDPASSTHMHFFFLFNTTAPTGSLLKIILKKQMQSNYTVCPRLRNCCLDWFLNHKPLCSEPWTQQLVSSHTSWPRLSHFTQWHLPHGLWLRLIELKYSKYAEHWAQCAGDRKYFTNGRYYYHCNFLVYELAQHWKQIIFAS